MKLIALTVAFCPASQLARCLFEYRKSRTLTPDRHIVVMGHYPINTEKNNRDIKMLVESYGEAELLDPGKNIGSAQSQWFALQQLNLNPDSYWINVDPDSACRDKGWDYAAKVVMENDPNCIVCSCNSPLVEKIMAERNQEFIEKEITLSFPPVMYGVLERPTPFNLSLWRYSFFQEIGGIPQLGEYWGEVEAGTLHYAAQKGKYQAYLLDFMEDERGKFMQDKQLVEFKDLNMRTPEPDRFPGNFLEYLHWKYPALLETDTFIPDETIFK